MHKKGSYIFMELVPYRPDLNRISLLLTPNCVASLLLTLRKQAWAFTSPPSNTLQPLKGYRYSLSWNIVTGSCIAPLDGN